MTKTLLFIDADNQPPLLASVLTRFLKAIDRTSTRAVVAGNGVGDRVRGWEQALREAIPCIDVCCHVAPLRKQSADVRLMFELAPFYHDEPDCSELLIIVSRDELFLAATECLVARGLNAMLAFGTTANATPMVTDVPVVLLSAPQPPTVQAPLPKAIEATTQPVNGTAPTIDPKIVTAAIKKIRQTLSPNKQGGFAASAVGQVLSQLGHEKATRAKIVRAIPNLKEVGSGSDKRLIF